MATDEVLKFLTHHNRPFSANDVQQSVPGEFGKTAIQKALDSLVSQDKVIEKVYNKQKVYFASQKTDVPIQQFKENLMQVDRDILDLSLQVTEVTNKLTSYNANLAVGKQKISLEEAEEKKASVEKEFEEIKSQIADFVGVDIICPKEKVKVEALYNKTLGEYRKRKRLCMDVLNSILENYPKSKKHLFDEIGIETDEDVKFSVDSL